jgi:hypothetical protein
MASRLFRQVKHLEILHDTVVDIQPEMVLDAINVFCQLTGLVFRVDLVFYNEMLFAVAEKEVDLHPLHPDGRSLRVQAERLQSRGFQKELKKEGTLIMETFRVKKGADHGRVQMDFVICFAYHGQRVEVVVSPCHPDMPFPFPFLDSFEQVLKFLFFHPLPSILKKIISRQTI